MRFGDSSGIRDTSTEATKQEQAGKGTPYRSLCGKCGARRIDQQLGLEATPDEYVAGMVAVFREVWRVLRDDGVCFVNLGDSYAPSRASELSRDSSGIVPQSCPLRGSPWNHPCDGCRAASVLRTFHTDPQPDYVSDDVSSGDIRAHKGFGPGRFPNGDSSPQKERPRSSSSSSGLPPSLGRADEPPPSSQESRLSRSSQRPQGDSPQTDSYVPSRDVALASSRDDRESDSTMEDQREIPTAFGAVPDQPSHTGDSNGIAGVSAFRIEDTASLACPYLDSTRSFWKSKLKPKDLCGIPWRVAFALQADGWYLRSDIIWSKPNPMPESVTDRPTKAHEYVFLLAKRERYWYDADAVREPLTYDDPRTRMGLRRVKYEGKGTDASRNDGDASWMGSNPSGRNRRTVWTVATQPFPGAHFATFPPKLVEPCLLAGCPERVCAVCGAGWRREVDSSEKRDAGCWSERGGKKTADTPGRAVSPSNVFRTGMITVHRTLGFAPSCQRSADTRPGVVLDPFAGAGTVGVVAARLNRDFVGIELNEKYAAMSEARIARYWERNPELEPGEPEEVADQASLF